MDAAGGGLLFPQAPERGSGPPPPAGSLPFR